MRLGFNLGLAIVTVALMNAASDEASARGRRYPLTRCGPEQDYLCPIHGYFDQAPFQYNLAIYPGCIRAVPVETPHGIRRRLTVVCG